MKIAIITINYNNATGLARTIQSVVNQTSKEFEYIIVDGASTDESLQYLESINCGLQTANYKLLSEPDTGIYNAMNKGIKMATGDYLLFINSGDELADNTVVEKLQNALLPDTEIASGGLTIINDKGALQLLPPADVSLSYSLKAGLTHPNTIIRKLLFEKYGLYNEQNKIVSDWEFFLVAAGLNNCKYQQLDFTVARFYEDGISSQNKDVVNTEMQEAIKRLVPEPIQKDIKRLQKLESMNAHPAYLLLHQSIFLKNLLTFFYKIRRKIRLPHS